ncbi:MAG: tetratricopeptide repeat protein [bacterium]|nr:tetratricopeptide repeat protein [bacterium]
MNRMNQMSRLAYFVFFLLGFGLGLIPCAFAQTTAAPTPTKPLPKQQPQNLRDFQAGQQFEMRGKYDEALEQYRRILQTTPGDVNALQGVARVLARTRKYEELEQHWQQYYSQAPVYMRPQIDGELGALLWRRGDHANARARWDAALNVNRNEGGYTALNNVLLQYGIHEEAIRILLEGRTKLGNPTLFSYQLLQLYLSAMNPRAAALEAVQQVRINPGLESNWSYWLTQFGEETETVNTLRDVLQSELEKPAAPAVRGGIASILASVSFHTGNFTAAVSETNLADSLLNGRGIRLFGLANQLLGEGEVVAAKSALQIATRRQSGETPQILELLAKLELAQGDTVASRSRFEELVKKYPTAPESETGALTLARSYLPRQPEQAAEWARKALLHPMKYHPAEARVILIEAALAQGSIPIAERIRNEALHSNGLDLPKFSGQLSLLGFRALLLSDAPDSLVTNGLTLLDQVRFDDPASVEALRWRLLWNSCTARPELLAVLRKGERAYVTGKPFPALDSLNLTKQDEAEKELLARIIVWTEGTPQQTLWIDRLLTQFPTEPRLPGFLLQRAETRYRQGDTASALRDLELILQRFPNRPEEERARKLLRAWSKEG